MIKLSDYDYKTKDLKDLRHACLVNCLKASAPEIVLDLLKKRLILETTKISKDKNTDKTNSKNIKNDINFIKRHFIPKKERKSSAVKKAIPTKPKTKTKSKSTKKTSLPMKKNNNVPKDSIDDSMS